MYMCVCALMYVCVCACVHTHTSMHTCTRMFAELLSTMKLIAYTICCQQKHKEPH